MIRFMTEDVRNIKSALIAFGFFMVSSYSRSPNKDNEEYPI